MADRQILARRIQIDWNWLMVRGIAIVSAAWCFTFLLASISHATSEFYELDEPSRSPKLATEVEGISLRTALEHAGQLGSIFPYPSVSEIGASTESVESPVSADPSIGIPVPEPSSLLLLTLSGGLIMFLRWRWG